MYDDKPTKKEFKNRKEDIEKELETLFKANLKIADWDVPEIDNDMAAQLLLDILQDKLDSIKADVKTGKYDFY
ncbi:MAG: hypothetical protein ACQESH_02230 [Campylobacterota bacterium]